MGMSEVAKDKLRQWIIGLSGTIIAFLLSLILYYIQEDHQLTREIHRQNNLIHSMVSDNKSKIDGHDRVMRFFENRLDDCEDKAKDQEKRLSELEFEFKLLRQ